MDITAGGSWDKLRGYSRSCEPGEKEHPRPEPLAFLKVRELETLKIPGPRLSLGTSRSSQLLSEAQPRPGILPSGGANSVCVPHTFLLQRGAHYLTRQPLLPGSARLARKPSKTQLNTRPYCHLFLEVQEYPRPNIWGTAPEHCADSYQLVLMSLGSSSPHLVSSPLCLQFWI